VLDLIDLTRRFGDVVALDGVSFSVPGGEMVGFVGPNGAGKTTAMRIVLGVLQADSGEVRWRGKRVDAAVRRRFGYMPEERGLYPKMRVLDQLAYLGRLHGLDAGDARARSLRTIEILGVADRVNDRTETLSLGNQQRVQLAAALAHEPEVLVLDEPFSGLDPVGVDTLAGVLREQAAAGVPVLADEAYLHLRYDAGEPAPLAAADPEAPVLTVGTFSKTISPGLRVAWIAGPAPVIARLALLKQVTDLHANSFTQRMVHRHHPPPDRGEEVRDRLVGLHHAEGLPLPQGRSDRGELHEHHVTQRVLREVRDADHALPAFHAQPFVLLRVAEVLGKLHRHASCRTRR